MAQATQAAPFVPHAWSVCCPAGTQVAPAQQPAQPPGPVQAQAPFLRPGRAAKNSVVGRAGTGWVWRWVDAGVVVAPFCRRAAGAPAVALRTCRSSTGRPCCRACPAGTQAAAASPAGAMSSAQGGAKHRPHRRSAGGGGLAEGPGDRVEAGGVHARSSSRGGRRAPPAGRSRRSGARVRGAAMASAAGETTARRAGRCRRPDLDPPVARLPGGVELAPDSSVRLVWWRPVALIRNTSVALSLNTE